MQYRILAIAIFFTIQTVSARAATPIYKYECQALGRGGNSSVQFTLKIAGARAQLARGGNKYEGELDRDYNPRTNTNYFRYQGWNGLDNEARVWLLIEKSLLKGGRELKNGNLGGVVKIQSRGETYDGLTYGCLSRESQ